MAGETLKSCVLLGLGTLSPGAGPLLLFLDHVFSLEPGILPPADTAGGETPGRFRRTSLVDVKNRESGAIIQMVLLWKKGCILHRGTVFVGGGLRNHVK